MCWPEEGEEIKFQDLRTEEQKDLMKYLIGMVKGGLQQQQGATIFPGQLSAPPDPSQFAAMNTMMGMGGYGPYTPPQPPGPAATATPAARPSADPGEIHIVGPVNADPGAALPFEPVVTPGVAGVPGANIVAGPKEGPRMSAGDWMRQYDPYDPRFRG